MPAYVISEVDIVDEAVADRYRRLAETSIDAYGGRYLVRGSAVDVAEGDSSARQMVIVEFPSLARVHEWYRSREYGKALNLRNQALARRLVFVDGIAGGACSDTEYGD